MNEGFTLDGRSDNVNEVLLWHNVWNFSVLIKVMHSSCTNPSPHNSISVLFLTQQKCKAAATFIWISAPFILTPDKNKQGSLASI